MICSHKNPSRASYRVSIVNILEKTNRVLTARTVHLQTRPREFDMKKLYVMEEIVGSYFD